MRPVALKAISDLIASISYYVNVDGKGKDKAASRRNVENKARLELFAATVGLLDEGEHGWRAKKMNFMLHFLQNVVGRELSKKRQSERAEATRDRLTKKRHTVKLTSVAALSTKISGMRVWMCV